MIDLHCHILHGIDDGPETLEESVEMCRKAHDDGIRAIVATPHFRPGRFERTASETAGKAAALNEELRQRGIPLTILAGADVTVTPELPEYLAADRSLFLNGTGMYFLAELPHEAMPPQWDRFLLSLRSRGITPILTHPERNRWLLKNPEQLAVFVMAGGMVQLTAMSVTGEFGEDIREYCGILLRRNLAQVIATDAHSVDLRPPILSAAVDAASSIIGRGAAWRLVYDNPLGILEGKPVEVPEPVVVAARKRSWFQKVLDL